MSNLGEEVGTGLEVFTNVDLRRLPGKEIAGHLIALGRP